MLEVLCRFTRKRIIVKFIPLGEKYDNQKKFKNATIYQIPIINPYIPDNKIFPSNA